MSASLAEWLEAEAASQGIGVSALIETIAQQHRDSAMLNDAPATEPIPLAKKGVQYKPGKKKAS